VLHVEARAFLKSVFHEDGTAMTLEEEVELINGVIKSI
jgi:hypothetical protein